MKKYIFVIFLFLFCLSVAPLSAKAEAVLITDKTVYLEGDPIVVKAEGSGKDWVGIYLKTDLPQTMPAIRWYYVAADGNMSGKGKNVRRAERVNDSRAALADIPEGEYTVYLFENDKYKVLAKTDVTVTANENPEAIPSAPESVVYTRTKSLPGYADGTLTVKVGSGATPEGYIAYWGDANGPLSDYTAFAPINYEGATTAYNMVSNTLIPTQADRIYVYASRNGKVSEQAAVALMDSSATDYDFGTPLYEIQIISDIHLNSSNDHIHNVHFAKALQDIKTLSPGSMGIFINGDIADHAEVAEYQRFNELIEGAGEGLPPVYCAIGNHDLKDGPFETRLNTFLSFTEPGTDSVYYDLWLEGVHFIFLGSEAPGLNAELSETQLNWFEQKLAENRDENRPIYVFLHQGLMDTVAGTFEYQKWHGINQSEAFAAILKKYPEVVMFSGHSHWELDSVNSMKSRDENLPTIFNTAAGGYLWNDAAMYTDEGIEGSQGYFIYAYEDRLVVRGRDFDNGKWISSAFFNVSFSDEQAVSQPKDEGLSKGVITALAVGGGLLAAGAVVGTTVAVKKKKRKE